VTGRLARVLRGSWDIGAGLLVFGGYLVVAARIRNRLPEAEAHARQVVAAEQWLRIPAEQPMNVWIAQHRPLAVLANYHYSGSYLLSTIAVLVWLRVADRPGYSRHALSLLAINAAAIVVFRAYPVSPPRLLAGAGAVDTVQTHGTVGSWGSGMIESFANQHAAMPSLHVAWATWVALTLIRQRVPRWLQRVSVVHVGTTTAVIALTGNHWWLDAVAGAALAVAVDSGVARVRLPRRARAAAVARADVDLGDVCSPSYR
jgi:PAP2 superfamily